MPTSFELADAALNVLLNVEWSVLAGRKNLGSEARDNTLDDAALGDVLKPEAEGSAIYLVDPKSLTPPLTLMQMGGAVLKRLKGHPMPRSKSVRQQQQKLTDALAKVNALHLEALRNGTLWDYLAHMEEHLDVVRREGAIIHAMTAEISHRLENYEISPQVGRLQRITNPHPAAPCQYDSPEAPEAATTVNPPVDARVAPVRLFDRFSGTSQQDLLNYAALARFEQLIGQAHSNQRVRQQFGGRWFLTRLNPSDLAHIARTFFAAGTFHGSSADAEVAASLSYHLHKHAPQSTVENYIEDALKALVSRFRGEVTRHALHRAVLLQVVSDARVDLLVSIPWIKKC